jgi:hypothetical protein
MPKGQHIIDGAYVTQEHALFCHGQFVSQGKNIFLKAKPGENKPLMKRSYLINHYQQH